ncbi:hypothetical protein ABZZ80_13280 [Streptomyces sp. NPDC006356]
MPGLFWLGLLWFGTRLSAVPGVRPSEPDVRGSGVCDGVVRGVVEGVVELGVEAGPDPVADAVVPGVEAGVLRGVTGDVGLGVEAGPVPEGVPGVPAEGFLAGPELGFGLVADEVPAPPEAPGPWCPPGAAPPVEGAVGDVGMPEPPPSDRPPEPAGDESAVGVGAALDCVGALAASPSIWVPMEPPPGEEDVPPDDGAPDVGADCALGDDRPDTGEPPPECEGPDVLGVLDDPLESEPLDEGLPGEGSSKSDRDELDGDCVGLEYGLSEEDEFPESTPEPEPESGPAPMLGAGMSFPPVSAEMPLPMFAPGMPLPERVDEEESDPDELESEDEESEEEESDEEESELPGPESLPTSLPMSPPEGPSYPSIRLSTACRARLPAFWPRLSRRPSAKVWGLCRRASRPASPPALSVAPTS